MCGTPPLHDPHANGVAERAVKEFMSQLRRLKLGLEYRLRCKSPPTHPIMDCLSEHASFLIEKF